jgi:hypothetical protein
MVVVLFLVSLQCSVVDSICLRSEAKFAFVELFWLRPADFQFARGLLANDRGAKLLVAKITSNAS